MAARARARECLVSAFSRLGTFIFNKETKEVFGRKCISWTKLGGFFFTLYAVLGGIFAIHLSVFVALTPKPGLEIEPWNYGKYAYPNYPNSKIVLVTLPKIITYRQTVNETVLSQTDEAYIERLVPSAIASGVSIDCLNTTNKYGFDIGQPCIFIHVLRVYNWIFNETIDTMLVNCTFSSSHVNVTITSPMDGIPLNISGNNIDGRSFPFKGQQNYTTPVMAIQLNLNSIPPQSLPQEFRGTVTCSVDLASMGIYVPEENLQRQYGIPADGTTIINFI